MNTGVKIYYHEDFYRQKELVPEENYFSAGRFIDEYPTKEGSIYGFYGITSRPEQKVKLLDRSIPFEDIKKALDVLCFLYSEDVETGYGSTEVKDENSVVWGFEQYGIFAKRRENHVEAIWLCSSYLFPKDRAGQHLSKALFMLTHLYNLVLIDWDSEIICRFNSESSVKNYLTQNLAFD